MFVSPVDTTSKMEVFKLLEFKMLPDNSVVYLYHFKEPNPVINDIFLNELGCTPVFGSIQQNKILVVSNIWERGKVPAYLFFHSGVQIKDFTKVSYKLFTNDMHQCFYELAVK